MPYQIKWQKNGVVWHYYGVLTGNELLQSNFDIFGDERFDYLRYQIVDLTGIDKVEVTEKHMRKIAHLDMAASRTNPRVKVAVVAQSDPAAKLCDLYDEFCGDKSPWENKLFRNMEDAKAWVRGSSS